MTPRPLLQEPAATLKALCASCGLSKTGTKALLVHRLRHAAQHFRPVPPSARILSIDLGIKNFAFSLLTPAKPSKTNPPPSTSPLTSPVHLHAWHRLDLTLPLAQPTTTTTKPSKKPSPPPPPPQTEENNPTPEKEKEKEKETDPFSPPALASLTLSLLHSHLLPLKPTHILIERQRFRTGGGAAVAEWTLRVNSLEAMLHAALAALNGRTQAGLGWEGTVGCVLPRGVAGFLFPGDDTDSDGDGGGEKKGRGGAYQVLKREKVGLVGGFLKGGSGLVVPEEGQAKEMVRLFLRGLEERERRGGKRGAGKKGEKEVEEIVTKMDDLSDAVLQGMVWLQWQRNLEGLIRERPELLEEDE